MSKTVRLVPWVCVAAYLACFAYVMALWIQYPEGRIVTGLPLMVLALPWSIATWWLEPSPTGMLLMAGTAGAVNTVVVYLVVRYVIPECRDEKPITLSLDQRGQLR